MEPVVVIDFETTGLSPDYGDRATEIAAVLIRDGRIVDQYQSLMNAGRRIPSFIEYLTGISKTMVREAPPAKPLMSEIADFVGDYPLVAHNGTCFCRARMSEFLFDSFEMPLSTASFNQCVLDTEQDLRMSKRDLKLPG
ncbi:Exonuclease RNase T and DNA polymerase III [Thiocapsa marina 5811]|uniref:Exonuclease RNase T and DNA polymerase III n=2 Tax=Thiocapsa marina TaxID=244573 RepID=F9UH40_9GAMM|nr:Exonuclease RNase T and DNA polymerase III [Thiocapsa marina 5811]